MDIMKKQSGLILAYVILVILLASAECAAENKTLLFVGNDSYPPISYQEGGQPKGLAIDIVRALGQRMGWQIDIRLMEWKVAQAMVAQGKADALCQLTVTEPRKQIYDFSDQAHDLSFSIFVRTGKQGINDLTDLRGLQVAVITASVQHQYVTADSQIKYTLTSNDLQGFQLLKDGKVDAVLADLWAGSYVLAEKMITGIQTSGEPFAHLASALAVKKGNTALLAAINDGLRSLQADGTIERINEKWRPQEIIIQTREQAVRKTYSVLIGILVLLLVVGTFWLITLRRKISERKLAEDKLREKSEELDNYFISSLDLLCIANVSGQFIRLNPEWEKVLGYSISELEERLFLDFVHPDDMEGTLAAISKLGAQEQVLSFENRYLCKDGSYRWIEWRSHPKGDLIYAAARDITERKQAEKDKAKLEAQLQQSQKMEAIGTLAGGIAHDFNNILGAIIGYTEMAVEEDQNEIQKQYLQETLSGAERARNLVKQILTFSRQDDHEKKPLDIKVLLQEAVKFLRASIPTTIAIDQYITEESCNIMADPTQMHQIIMNLCTNASHAMKEAGGTLKIELANVDLTKDEIPNHPDLQPGHFVKLTISDTGHGIDPALIQRIFDPFFTTKSVDEGTGLGLSVVYGIVKSHGGIINVYSEPDKGAAFHVYLPRITYGEDMKVDRRKPVTGGTERILFVDDEPALVDLGTRMLSSLGYEVESVLSSVEALDLFHTKPESFDLVITDMTLPKMTGIDLSRNLLKIRPNIPIILCSGIKDPDTEAQVKSMGIKAYIMKPLTKRELAGVMREVLDGRE